MVQLKHTTHMKCVTGVMNKQRRQENKFTTQYMNKSVHFQGGCMLMNLSCFTPTITVLSLLAKSKIKNVIAIMTQPFPNDCCLVLLSHLLLFYEPGLNG